MSREIVVAFHPDGTVQHTLEDKDFKLDLGVPRDIDRMSEIKHMKALGFFYIIGVLPPIAGMHFDIELAKKYDADIDRVPYKLDRRGVFMMGSYEDAVSMEKIILNAMRLDGVVIDHVSSGQEIGRGVRVMPDEPVVIVNSFRSDRKTAHEAYEEFNKLVGPLIQYPTTHRVRMEMPKSRKPDEGVMNDYSLSYEELEKSFPMIEAAAESVAQDIETMVLALDGPLPTVTIDGDAVTVSDDKPTE